jgi:hypothetical protein
MDCNSLVIGVLAGIVGGAYLLYGRKTSKVTPMVCGVALMVYPYFVDNAWLLLGIGAALCIAPFVVKE